MFHTARGKAVYHTVFMGGVFGPAEAALPAEKQWPRFHDPRRTRATLLIAAGAHAKRVQERLGHSSITTTLNLYGHVLPPRKPPWSTRATRSPSTATRR